MTRRGTGGEWSVVGTDGRTHATVRVPDDLVLMDISGDLIAGIAYDEFNVQRVQVHRVQR